MQNLIFYSIQLLIALLSFYLGTLHNECPIQKPCPACPINITGNISSEGGLFNLKKRIQIDFNGYQVLTGYIDKTNQANLNGSFQGDIVTASCSGAEKINCLIHYKNKDTQLSFTPK